MDGGSNNYEYYYLFLTEQHFFGVPEAGWKLPAIAIYSNVNVYNVRLRFPSRPAPPPAARTASASATAPYPPIRSTTCCKPRKRRRRFPFRRGDCGVAWVAAGLDGGRGGQQAEAS